METKRDISFYCETCGKSFSFPCSSTDRIEECLHCGSNSITVKSAGLFSLRREEPPTRHYQSKPSFPKIDFKLSRWKYSLNSFHWGIASILLTAFIYKDAWFYQRWDGKVLFATCYAGCIVLSAAVCLGLFELLKDRFSLRLEINNPTIVAIGRLLFIAFAPYIGCFALVGVIIMLSWLCLDLLFTKG